MLKYRITNTYYIVKITNYITNTFNINNIINIAFSTYLLAGLSLYSLNNEINFIPKYGFRTFVRIFYNVSKFCVIY